MSDELRIPRAAALLGYAGVLPFAACAAGLWWARPGSWHSELQHMLALYGAVILSFLGGVRWGCEINANPGEPHLGDLVAAVVPSVLAWCAVCLPGTVQPLLALLLAFAVYGVFDVAEAGRGAWPAWYSRLRLRLSVLVALALVSALLGIARA
jgi:hypothetical protein